MQATIKTRPAFRTLRQAAVLDYTLVLDSLEDMSSAARVKGEIPRSCVGGWLILSDAVWLISSITPGRGDTDLGLQGPGEAFSRPRLYTAYSGTVGGFLARELEAYRDESDAVYALPYERDVHPYYKKQGAVKALETIRFSVTTHRGCYGECNFCAIAVHEGRTVQWRSEESILKEIRHITTLPGFKGYIPDMGGPDVKDIESGILEPCGEGLGSLEVESLRVVPPVLRRGIAVEKHMTQAGKGEISLVEVFPGALEEMAPFGTREFRGWILVAEYDVAYKGE